MADVTLEEMAEQCKQSGTIGVGKVETADGNKLVVMLLPVARKTEDGQKEEHVISVAITDQQALLFAEKLLLVANSEQPGWVKEQ